MTASPSNAQGLHLSQDNDGVMGKPGPPTNSSSNVEGILSMEDYNLPMEAFEIAEDLHNGAALDNSNNFAFKRSAKRSIMMGLGVAPGTEGAGAHQDALDAYSKMDDVACALTYMSVVVGAGTFTLSQAVAMVGWLQGTLMFLGLGVWNYCLAHLVTGLPQMLEGNFETFATIARSFLGPYLGNAFLLLSMTCWWCACVFQLIALQGNLSSVISFWLQGTFTSNGFDKVIVRLVCIFPALIFIFKTRGNQLVKVAKLAIAVMFFVAIVEVASALIHYTYNWFFAEPFEVVPWRSARHPCLNQTLLNRYYADTTTVPVGFYPALKKLILAYAGVGFWPYVVADMLHPQNAQKVVKNASVQIGSLYGVVGIFCYMGWGDELLFESPIQMMMRLGPGYQVAASINSILFSVKAFCAYPLMFRPLFREMETLLPFEEFPAVVLRLPWALQLAQRSKLIFRLLLAMLTYAPLFLLEGRVGRMQAFGNLFGVCVCIVQLLAPGLFVLKSLRVHKRILEGSGRRGTAAAIRMRNKYLFGSLEAHTIIGALVGVISSCFGVLCLCECAYSLGVFFISGIFGNEEL